MPTTETASKAVSPPSSGGDGDAGLSYTLCDTSHTLTSAGDADVLAIPLDTGQTGEDATALLDLAAIETSQAELSQLQDTNDTQPSSSSSAAATSQLNTQTAASTAAVSIATTASVAAVTVASSPITVQLQPKPAQPVITLTTRPAGNAAAQPVKKVITVSGVVSPGGTSLLPSMSGPTGLGQVKLTAGNRLVLSSSGILSSHVASSTMQTSAASEQSLFTSAQGQTLGVRTLTGQKRPLVASSSGQSLVTKVILKENPDNKRPQAYPVLTPGPNKVQVGHQQILLTNPGVGGTPAQPGSLTPTKTLTMSQTSLLSPTKLLASPTKQVLQAGGKITLSPVKAASGTRITMVPVSGRSPQKIAPAPGGQVITMVAKSMGMGALATNTLTTTAAKQTTAVSPSKLIIRQPQGQSSVVRPVLTQQLNMVPKASNAMATQYSNVQPVPVTGSKFQYVRLVTQPTTVAAGPRVKSIAPSTSLAGKTLMTTMQPHSSQMKITLPVTQQQQMVAKPHSSNTQRILLPANSAPIRPNLAQTTLAQIRPAGSGGITQLPPGTTIIQPGQNLAGVQGFALVPAQYVTQIQPAPPTLPVAPAPQDHGNFVPIASSGVPPQQQNTANLRPNVNGSVVAEPAGQRPRKPCNCTKSQCLKLYCDCFANGEFCHNCNCNNCANNLSHEEERARAIKACLDRNPNAFRPKIGKSKGGEGNRRHNKGCNCKRSGCLKNYCECYEAKILCSNLCKCIGCKNYEESPDRKTLMHLADAAEVRVQQQTAVKSKFSSQIQDVPPRPPPQASGERLPFTFVTREVAEATCACLIAQAEEAERTHQLDVIEERMILEEFGRCLMQVIESSNRTKAESPVP